MGFDVKDGANDDERTRAEKETLSWAYDSEEEIVEKINRVLHDKKTTWGKRIARAKLLLDELRRRVSVKE